MSRIKDKPEKTLPLPVTLWQEIGNMLDFWEQMPNDLRSDIEDANPGFFKAIERICSSPQFAATK